MAMSSNDMKQELFKRYALNFTACFPGHEQLFGCPLCFRVFGIEALDEGADARDPVLSVEHVVPESVGGRIVTLTCRVCNNRDGSEIDAHLTRRFRFEDSFAGLGDEPIKARLRAKGGHKTQAVDWHIRGGDQPHFVLYGVPKASHPDAPNEILAAMHGGRSIDFLFESDFIAARSRIALIRAAYLMLFRYFGYGYLRYGTAEIVREQIKRYDDDLFGHPGVVTFENPPFPGEMNRLYAIYEPVELRCFFVALEAKAVRNRYFGVIMPGLDSESSEVYKRWAALGQKTRSFSVSPLQIRYDPNHLINPTCVSFVMDVWGEVIREGFKFVDGKAPQDRSIPFPIAPRLMYDPN